MPVVVVKKIIRIQREFLWGGVKGGRKINWVSWKEVCRPRSQGGLGVRDVWKANLSLLIKWRWRLLEKGNALWKEVLKAKYGSSSIQKVHWIGSELPSRASLWWKDLCGLDVQENGSWFARNLSRRLGNGNSTRFWLDVWFGNLSLGERFPRLFSISLQKDAMVSNFWVEKEGVWGWEFDWRRRLFAWEDELLRELREVLPPLAFTGM
ncbi:RNA-directed DNA polymerase (Reverse transcriptase), partial [Trifolium medium]|nr:RNA-directed DNA polymerase (Reverse transcriptase) [Trifolium medium]